MSNFNESIKKANRLKKSVSGDKHHHAGNIETIQKNLVAKNERLQEMANDFITMQNGNRVVQYFFGLYDMYKKGQGISPIVVFTSLVSPEVNVIGAGRSKEENKNAVYLLINDTYFKEKEEKSNFLKWFDELWVSVEEYIEFYENLNHEQNLMYIQAHEGYMKDLEDKKKKKGKK